MPRIIVDIDRKGGTKVEGEGFVGNSCEAATEAIRQRLGGEEETVEHKSEFYEEHETEG